MRGEHMLDRPLEQRAQPLGDLLGRHAVRQPLGRISRPWPKSTSVSPAMTAPPPRPKARRRSAPFPGTPPLRRAADRPPRTNAPRPRPRPAARPRPGCPRRPAGTQHRGAEPLRQALRIALMPRARQHDRRLAVRRKLDDLSLARPADRTAAPGRRSRSRRTKPRPPYSASQRWPQGAGEAPRSRAP